MKQIIVTIISSIITAIAGGLIMILFNKFIKSPNQNQTAEKIKEEKLNEIEKIPASDLVSNAPNADDLFTDTDRISERAKQQLRDRIRKILSRVDNSGNTGSDGN